MTQEVILNHSLKDLTESLRIGLVVFIENDFKPVSGSDDILAGMVTLNDIDKKLLIEELKQVGLDVFVDDYNQFNADFNKLLQNEDTIALVGLGKMLPAINKLPDNSTCLASHDKVSKCIASLQNDDLFQMCFKFGIGQTPETYNPIFDQLKLSGEKLSFRYYTQVVASEIEGYGRDISAVCSASNKNSYLCIVDKMLGEEKHEGLLFVKNDLPKISSTTSTTPISFIFSSQPDPEGEMDSIDQYFSRQIDKNTTNVSDEITIKLAQCAYARMFQRFQNVYKDSCEAAANLVIKNHKNINHILIKAQAEGLTPFEAVFNWFQSALDMNVQKKLTADYSGTFGLTKFFANKYLPVYQNNEAIDKELLELNTFEIFDYDVNKKHLSIGSGDVFYKDNKYYVVVGQECDLLIREEDNKRNDKVIELLEAKFDVSDSNKKLSFTYDDTTKSIMIENFVHVSGARGRLIIKNLTNHKLASPELLDLCMYNSDGLCKLDLDSNLNEGLRYILPAGKDVYFDTIKTKLKEVYDLQEAHPVIAKQFEFIDFNNWRYTKTGPAVGLDYGFARVCRIKGNFRHFINKAFYDFRGRIDLNLVNNTEESYDLKTVTFRLSTMKQKEISSVRVYQTEGKLHIKRNEITSGLSDELLTLVQLLPNNSISLQSGDHYDVNVDNEIIINLYFIKSFGGSNKPIKGNKASFRDLLGGSGQLQNDTFQFIDDESIETLLDVDGKTPKKFDVVTFVRKARIDHNGLKHIYIQGPHLIIENAPAGSTEEKVVINISQVPVAEQSTDQPAGEQEDNSEPKKLDKDDEEKVN